mgnify:CR=1 FL=1
MFGGSFGEVDDCVATIGSTVSDFHYNNFAVFGVAHVEERPEGQCAVSTSEGVFVVGRTVGSSTTVPSVAIVGGVSHFGVLLVGLFSGECTAC